MAADIFSRCSHSFKLYLKKLTQNIIIVFDKKMNILNYNQKLVEILNIDEKKLKNKNIEDLLQIKSLKDFRDKIDEKNDSYQQIEINFNKSILNTNYINFNCYIFAKNDNYCLIGEKSEKKDQKILEKISLLNNKLANKTRELTKKNKELQKAKNKIEKLSKTDQLTGLPNRRHFLNYLQKIFSQAKRHSQSLSMVMIDLDKFKNINDTYGHDAGDQALSAVGKLLNEETREADLAARIGGEEFTVVLTNTDLNNAQKYAERIRKKIANLDIEKIPVQITASLGVAVYKSDNDYEAIMNRADKALYKAKESGRNKVCTL